MHSASGTPGLRDPGPTTRTIGGGGGRGTAVLVAFALALVSAGAAAAAPALGGPRGTTYDIEPLLAQDTNGDGTAELYRIVDVNLAGDQRVVFDGVAESLRKYCCSKTAVPSITEDFIDNGNGTATIAITMVSLDGSDLFPSGIVSDPGNVPLTGAALTLGYFQGSDPLDWQPAQVVSAATIDLRRDGGSLTGGPVSLAASAFGAPGTWNGHLRINMPGWAGDGVDRIELRIVVPYTSGGGGPCTPDATHLCLNGGRFRVSAGWQTPAGAVGNGTAVPLTTDTGFFWFFSPSNLELVVKVLDGCGLNQRFWVFAGGLTDVKVALRVEDLVLHTEHTYNNPLGTPFAPIQDTQLFACGAAVAAATAPTEVAAAQQAAARSVESVLANANRGRLSAITAESRAESGADSGAAIAVPDTARSTDATPRILAEPAIVTAPTSVACIPDSTSLCLGGGRFLVRANWRTSDGTTGVATAVTLTPDTGYYWFFNASNVELVVKVLDACGIGGKYWVFAAGLTDVAVDLSVEDIFAGGQRRYLNVQGTKYRPIQDTAAFTCSGAHGETWNHVTGPPPVVTVAPPVPAGGQSATVRVQAPGASSIALTASGDGCGALAPQNASGANLVQTAAVAEFGECVLEASVRTGNTTVIHRTGFTVEPTELALPPLQLTDGLFLPGDPPAATAGAATITGIDLPQELVNGGTGELRIHLSSAPFAATVDTVIVKVPSANGYNGYWEAPARLDGSTVVADFALDPDFGTSSSAALAAYSWRRSASDDWGRVPKIRQIDAGASQPIQVAVRAGNAVTAAANASLTTKAVDSNLVQVSVTWSTPSDVDLHIIEPAPGEEIYYSHRTSSKSGATLDTDSVCKGGTENVTWPAAALTGEHIVRVNYYGSCTHNGSTSYVVTTRVCGQVETFHPAAFSGSGNHTGAGAGVEVTRFTPKCQYRVRGTARYEDRAPNANAVLQAPVPKPIRFAKIFVRSAEGKTVSGGEGTTKQDGSYDLSFEIQGGGDWFVEVEARQDDTLASQSVSNAQGTVYKARTESNFDLSQQDRTDVDLLAITAKENNNVHLGEAFNLLDMGVAAAAVYRQIHGSRLGPLTWTYTPGQRSCGTLKSCMAGVNHIAIGDGPGDPDGYDDFIALHELGHSWLRDKSSVSSAANPVHSEGILTEPLQSFDEGAATFFAAVALRSPIFYDSMGDGGPSYSIESPHQFIPRGTHNNQIGGNVSEAIVSAVLWDLIDRVADGYDLAGYRFPRPVFNAIVALKNPAFSSVGAPGPDLADVLATLTSTLPAESKVAVPDIARCNYKYPVVGGNCPP